MRQSKPLVLEPLAAQVMAMGSSFDIDILIKEKARSLF
jgi:hypothetical protein